MGWDSCPCSFQSKTCLAPTSWAARILLSAEPTPTRTRGHLKTSLRGGQGGTLLPSPLPPSSLLEAERAQNFPRFHHPSLFPQIILPSPSSLHFISISRPSSPSSLLPCPPPPPSSLTSLPSENSHAIRICRASITTISLSHNPKRYLYKTAVGMQDREATFRILEKKALCALRNSHLDPLSPYFNNIMNNNKRPESLFTCTWVSSTTIVGVSVRKKKHGRGQYVYLLQPRFVKYRSGVAPRKSRKRLSDSEVRDAIFVDELTWPPPPPLTW